MLYLRFIIEYIFVYKLLKKERIINKQSTFSIIYKLAAPTVMHMLLETSYLIVDAIWTGMIGPLALAAIGASNFLLWIMFCISEGLGVGINSLVSRAYGAKNIKKLCKISSIGIRLGCVIAFLMMIFIPPFLTTIFSKMHLDEFVMAKAIIYLKIIIIGYPVITIMIANNSIFRGVGDSKTPLKILIISLIINTFLTPALIFGIAFFPELGIAGGALASVISNMFGSVVGFIILKQRKLLPDFFPKCSDLAICVDIVKIATPLAVNQVVFCIVYMFITKIVAKFGSAPIAALAIGHRVESVMYCLCVGLSIAATTLVAQNIGAGDVKKAKKIAYMINLYTVFIIGFICTFLIFFANVISKVFTNDFQIIANSTSYLTIIALTDIFMALEIVMGGVLSGIGNTKPTLEIGLPLNVARIPIAYFLAKFLGISGVWWAIGISSVFKGILMTIMGKISFRKV